MNKDIASIVGGVAALLFSAQVAAAGDSVRELSQDVREFSQSYMTKMVFNPIATGDGCSGLSANVHSVQKCLNSIDLVHRNYGGLDVRQWREYQARLDHLEQSDSYAPSVGLSLMDTAYSLCADANGQFTPDSTYSYDCQKHIVAMNMEIATAELEQYSASPSYPSLRCGAENVRVERLSELNERCIDNIYFKTDSGENAVEKGLFATSARLFQCSSAKVPEACDYLNDVIFQDYLEQNYLEQNLEP